MRSIESTPLMRSIAFKICVAIFAVGMICWIVGKLYPSFYGMSTDALLSNDTLRKVETTRMTASSGERGIAASPTTRNAASSNALDTTYRPKTSHAVKQFLGAVDSNGDVDRRVPGWWLYAKSDAEAGWLDEYGFPTPSAEARLSKSNDAELAALVANGDLNAKAHQATRLAKAAFMNGNVAQAGQALGPLTRALGGGGGPYQAFTVYRTYAEMLLEYHYLPEDQKTAEQRAILDKYESTAQQALAYGSAFGDQAMLALYHTSGSRTIAGLTKLKEYSAAQFADTLAIFARQRLDSGLPPLTLNPRPSAPESPGQGVKGIILERY